MARNHRGPHPHHRHVVGVHRDGQPPDVPARQRDRIGGRHQHPGGHVQSTCVLADSGTHPHLGRPEPSRSSRRATSSTGNLPTGCCPAIGARGQRRARGMGPSPLPDTEAAGVCWRAFVADRTRRGVEVDRSHPAHHGRCPGGAVAGRPRPPPVERRAGGRRQPGDPRTTRGHRHQRAPRRTGSTRGAVAGHAACAGRRAREPRRAGRGLGLDHADGRPGHSTRPVDGPPGGPPLGPNNRTKSLVHLPALFDEGRRSPSPVPSDPAPTLERRTTMGCERRCAIGPRTHQPADQGRQVRIVVGVDPRPVSRAAMAWANALAGWLDAEVIVVHALDPTPSAARAEVPAPSIATQIAATLDRDWCAPLRDAAIPYRLLVQQGAPVGVMHDVVEQEAPDLLVVGRHTGVPAGGRGSTSLGVLAQPLVPTLVVAEQAPELGEPAPASGPGIPARRTLVGIDGSAPSLRALDLAVTLARAAGGDIVAVAAVEDAPVFPLGPRRPSPARAKPTPRPAPQRCSPEPAPPPEPSDCPYTPSAGEAPPRPSCRAWPSCSTPTWCRRHPWRRRPRTPLARQRQPTPRQLQPPADPRHPRTTTRASRHRDPVDPITRPATRSVELS